MSQYQSQQPASASAAIRSFASGLLNALSVPLDERSNSFPVPPPPLMHSSTSPRVSENVTTSGSTRPVTRAIDTRGGGGGGGGNGNTLSISLTKDDSYPSETERIATLAVKATKRASALEKRCRVLREGLLSAVGVLEDASAVLDELTGRPLGHWMTVDEKSPSSSSSSKSTTTSTSSVAIPSNSNGDLLLKAVRQEVGSLVQRSKRGLSAVAASISGQGFEKVYPEAPFVGFKLDMNRFYDDLLSYMDNNGDESKGENNGNNDRDKKTGTTISSSSAVLAFPDGGGGGGPMGNDEVATLSALCASQSAQLRKLNSDLISSQREHLSVTQELRAALSAALRMADQTKAFGTGSVNNGIDGVMVDDDEGGGGGKKSMNDAYTLQLLEQLKDSRDEVERSKKQETAFINEIEHLRTQLNLVQSESRKAEAKKDAALKESESEVQALKHKIAEADKFAAQIREKYESDQARSSAVEAHSAHMIKLQLSQLEAEVKSLRASRDQSVKGGGGGELSGSSPPKTSTKVSMNNSPVSPPSLELEYLRTELTRSEEWRMDLERRTKAQAAALEEAKVNAQSSVPVQYLKSVTIHFITIAGDPWSGTQRKPLVNVLATLLNFSPEERRKVGAPPAPSNGSSGVASVGYSLLVSPVSQEKKEGRFAHDVMITPSTMTTQPFSIPSIDTSHDDDETNNMRTIILSPNSKASSSSSSSYSSSSSSSRVGGGIEVHSSFPTQAGKGTVTKGNANTFFSLGVI
jgi:hypothetical protein